MTRLQARNEANKTKNAARFAKFTAKAAPVALVATPADALLASLRAHVESTDEHADGSRWGQVYLPNVGSGHSFAGHLSALTARGIYRPAGDPCFGAVRLA